MLYQSIGTWRRNTTMAPKNEIIFRQGLLMMFSFEDRFESINEALQEVKIEIFKILRDSLDLIQPYWTTHLSHMLECYNVTVEEEDEDSRNINILETEGHRDIEGPQLENSNITKPLKTRQVKIGTEAKSKFANIWDY